MGFFAPPDLFAAVAIATNGDPDLLDGSHLRLLPSPALGFPVAPLAIFRVTPMVVEPTAIWTDANGKSTQNTSLDAAGGMLTADILPPPPGDNAVDVAVEVVPAGPFSAVVSLIDRVRHWTRGGSVDRVFSQVSKAPFILGGPRVERVRIRGHGGAVTLRVWRVTANRIAEEMLGHAPLEFLSLPIDGSRPWYVKGLGRVQAMKKVENDAPRRLAPPDRPNGPFDPLAPADETARVTPFTTDIVDACERMLQDSATPPREQRLVRQHAAIGGRPRQFTDIGIGSTLLVQAMDPAVGRFLGLATRQEPQITPGQPVAYVAVGLFAFDGRTPVAGGRTLATAIGSAVPLADRVSGRVAALIDPGSPAAVDTVGPAMKRTTDTIRGLGMMFRGLIAVAGAVPASDLPAMPAPEIGPSHWLPAKSGPSTTFRQDFVVSAPPLGSLVAIGRLESGVWRSRHEPFKSTGAPSPGARAVAMMLGRTRERPPLQAKGFLSDSPVPAGVGPTTYRFALADLFGRYGKSVDLPVATPARSPPPPPAAQVETILDGPDGTTSGAASPGHIVARVPVPSILDLAAGSLDIAKIELKFDGTPMPAIAVPPETPTPAGQPRQLRIAVSPNIALPALQIGQQHRSTLEAVFVDTAGVRSQIAQVTVTFTDRRRPATIPTGLGLIWTSRPGPSPEVEVKLTWPGDAGTRYRVYMADEKTLGLPGPSRAHIAVAGGERDRAGTLGNRSAFRLLTDPPLETVGGRVVMDERLPRSLATVQFLRVVPLTGAGREAVFENCRVVPLAVPSDRRPPAPRISARIDPLSGHARLTVDALGLDLVELKAAEPGLFAQPPNALARAPEIRVRRASGPVPDPIYAREIKRQAMTLVLQGDKVTFRATLDDQSELLPFVRYCYWAEVRMPAERRARQDVTEIPPPNGVQPVEAAQIADMQRPFSEFSAPATTIGAPSGPPGPLGAATVQVVSAGAGFQMRLTAPKTPSAHPKAIGQYLLRVWEQWGSQDISLVKDDIQLSGGALDWLSPTVRSAAEATRPAKLYIAVIDPMERQGEIVTLRAT
jgi:hypothetical protein